MDLQRLLRDVAEPLRPIGTRWKPFHVLYQGKHKEKSLYGRLDELASQPELPELPGLPLTQVSQLINGFDELPLTPLNFDVGRVKLFSGQVGGSVEAELTPDQLIAMDAAVSIGKQSKLLIQASGLGIKHVDSVHIENGVLNALNSPKVVDRLKNLTNNGSFWVVQAVYWAERLVVLEGAASSFLTRLGARIPCLGGAQADARVVRAYEATGASTDLVPFAYTALEFKYSTRTGKETFSFVPSRSSSRDDDPDDDWSLFNQLSKDDFARELAESEQQQQPSMCFSE